MKINIKHIAKLANLPLKEEEIEKFEKQINAILEYVEILKKVDLENTRETSQITGLEDVEREDKAQPSLSQKQAISGAKNIHNGLFKVKAILEED